MTSAHIAALSGHTEILRFIADKHPDSLQQRSKGGFMPAHFTAFNGHIDTLKFIVEKHPNALVPIIGIRLNLHEVLQAFDFKYKISKEEFLSQVYDSL